MRTLQEWMQYVEEKRRPGEEPGPGDGEQAAEPAAVSVEGGPAAARRAKEGVESVAAVAGGRAAPGQVTVPRARRAAGPGVPAARAEANLVAAHQEQTRRALQALQARQRALPLDIEEPPAVPPRRMSVTETRDELIQRLLDPQLSLQDTAKLLGVCPTTVRRYTNRGILNHFRTPGNQRRFRLSDVLEFMQRQQKP